jgi:4-diphosphocytidyl-2-C-methyl-D-erythritol kinase
LITTPVKLPSFAKINWSLRILGKRPDGYHEVVTVLQTISLHDELTFELRENGPLSLSCDDPLIPVDDTNLVMKAALFLQERFQGSFGGTIHLRKRIPAQGGLGGGSSNAALALMAIKKLWQDKDLGIEELLDPAAGFGADVPFFLVGGRCRATGTGTTLTPLLDGPKQYLIIVTPNAKISTAHAYASLNAPSLTTSDSASILSSSLADLNSADSRQWPLCNDFERVIFEIEPEIERAKIALLDAGAWGALLAGSGSSVFGVFDNESVRDCGLKNLRCEAGWRVFSCETISGEEYFKALVHRGSPFYTLS